MLRRTDVPGRGIGVTVRTTMAWIVDLVNGLTAKTGYKPWQQDRAPLIPSIWDRSVHVLLSLVPPELRYAQVEGRD